MEQKLFFLINRQWTSPLADRLMAALSSLDAWVPLLLVVIVAVALFGGFKGRAFLATVVLTVALTDGVMVKYLKQWVNRPRPWQAQAVRVVRLKRMHPPVLGLFYPPKVSISRPESGPVVGRSFPSGHAANNFAVAVVFVAFFRRRGWLYFLPAAGVSYSRLYTGAHWPVDVAASVVLGVGMGLLSVALAVAFWRRWGASLAPGLYRRHPLLIEHNPGDR